MIIISMTSKNQEICAEDAAINPKTDANQITDTKTDDYQQINKRKKLTIKTLTHGITKLTVTYTGTCGMEKPSTQINSA